MRARFAVAALLACAAARADVAVPGLAPAATKQPPSAHYVVPRERAPEFYEPWGAQHLSDVSFFTPTPEQIERFERGLGAYLKSVQEDQFPRHVRQYVGVVWDHRPWIWVVAYDPDFSLPGRKISEPFRPIAATDLCTTMWRLSFELNYNAYVGFTPISGCA